MEEEVKIPLSKTQIIFMFIGALLFVVAGIWVIAIPTSKVELPGILRVVPPPMFALVGIASIVFFGWCSISISFKIFSNKPGLVLNKDSFWDNSSGSSAGHIPWSNVLEIGTLEVASQHLITILISNPEEIIEKQGFTARFWMKQNYKIYGTPIHISANALKIKHKELFRLLKDKYDEYQVKTKD